VAGATGLEPAASCVTGQRSASDLLGPHDDSFYAYSAKLLLFACS
jgi:hypothetical protein